SSATTSIRVSTSSTRKPPRKSERSDRTARPPGSTVWAAPGAGIELPAPGVFCRKRSFDGDVRRLERIELHQIDHAAAAGDGNGSPVDADRNDLLDPTAPDAGFLDGQVHAAVRQRQRSDGDAPV